MTMRLMLLFLFLLSLKGCQLSDTVEPNTLAQTWRFVGVGSHLADMSWPLDRFNYNNAPTLNLMEPKRMSGFSGINEYGGTVATTVDITHPQQLAISGKITIAALNQTKRGGTTEQMQVESQLLTGLQQATTYYLDAAYSQYYTLSISYGNNSEYIYFVSRR